MTEDVSTPVKLNITGGDYFQAMGIALLQGRAFTTAEAVSPNSSAIVSRSAAARLWPGANPLGQRLHYGDDGEEAWLTVVGAVEDVKHADWREAGEEIVYVPLTGPDPGMWEVGSPAYVVKSPRAEQLQREVREVVRQLAPEAPVYREQTMAAVARRSMIQLSFTMLTLGVVSGLALLLGAVGLYGVLSYVVAERRREIGVRMALGATARAVRRMVVAQGVRVVLIGVGIGVVVALASTRLLGALLYGVQAVDPLVFVGMSLMMLAIGALASWVPARRASGVNPIESLRSE
jgi:putative ABC transport system permease protein